MAKLLLGKEVAAAIGTRLAGRVSALRDAGVSPALAVIRCGADPADLSYEKALEAQAAAVGVAVQKLLLPEKASRQSLLDTIDAVNADCAIHGCLLFRPLPAHLAACQDEICGRLLPEKDVDCMTDLSLAGVFSGKKLGFPPCTPQACMEILAHYGIRCEGRRAVVIGRSLVVGRPAAMMLLAENATVTICHTGTAALPEITRQADIVLTAAGALGSLTRDCVRAGQTVIDVSVNWDPGRRNARGGLGSLAGDAVFDEIEPIVAAITPVPGGVGAVTSAVLMEHVVQAAERALGV